MAEDETRLQKIARLMKILPQIRNIATSAHIHHGKCISGDSRIILADGNFTSARELFDEVAEKGKVAKEDEEHVVYEPKEEIRVFSLNKKTGSIETKPISHVWRLVGGKTIKIKLRNGFEIETTPEHKYLVSRDLDFIEVEAKDLGLGDRIVCARKLETKSSLNMKEYILEKLSNENFYVFIEKAFSDFIKKKIMDYGIEKIKKDAQISIKAESFYYGIWKKNRYPLADLIRVYRLFNLNLEDVYDKIESISYRTGKRRGKNSLRMKLPTSNEDFKDFFYLAGLFLGDGSGKKFIVGKEELGDKFVKICKKFGISTITTKWKEKTPEIHTSMTLAFVLKCLFDYPLKKKSYNIKISNFVFNADSIYVANFLKGYFDCDGGIEKSRRAVTISSASKRMIEDLHLLLLRFGCISIKEKDNALSVSGLSALNFMKNIDFGIKEKADKLKWLVGKISGSIVCDMIKVGNQTMFVKKIISSKCNEELAFIEIKSIEQSFQDIVYDFTVPENHNFIAEGMVIHNTAFSDQLMYGAGMMSEVMAGEKLALNYRADEIERCMTIDSANVSMVHVFEGKDYLINLIDTPGHVDFSGDVTRAMRAIDGTFVLVCASEGIMPQTETVLKQALRERVQPLLFINKTDRLITELKLNPQQMQERFVKIIYDFNHLIEDIAEPEYKQKWKVSVEDGSVAFGSAVDGWALSVPFMKKSGVSFKDIIDIYASIQNPDERKKALTEKAPMYTIALDMVVKHLPNPIEAQKYRIPKIWHGELESELGKSLIDVDPKGKLAFVITKIIIDPRAGEISGGRLFSGTMKRGMEVYLNGMKQPARVQQVFIYNGAKTENMEEIPAGNVIGITGIKAYAGETVTLEPEQPFEELKHIFEPVITKAIEPLRPADLPKLVDVLKQVGKEDPTVRIEIDEETGENLMSGMGELHLEVIENRIKTEKGVDVKTSQPIVVYRETVSKKSPEVVGRSPNKHNDFFFIVEPLEDGVYQAIKNNEISEGDIKKKDENLWKKLSSLGISNEEARRYRKIYEGCVFIDKTKGIVQLGEVIELILEGFEQVVDAGPLCRERCTKLKVSLMDAKLHEDAIHRGPSQVYPAVRDAIKEGMIKAGATMFEPLQIHVIEVPIEYMSEVTKLVMMKRGQMLDVLQEGNHVIIKGKMPVAEMIGWISDLRSATEGRGNSSLLDQLFEKVPTEIQPKIVAQIRQRKGLNMDAPIV